MSSSAALAKSKRFASDLPICSGSPFTFGTVQKQRALTGTWNNCYGVYNYYQIFCLCVWKKEGEFRNGVLAKGWDYTRFIDDSGTRLEYFDHDNTYKMRINWVKKKGFKPSVLKTVFVELQQSDRKQLQTNLKQFGFYKSSIDGLYGKGTAAGLTAWNNTNLNGADLSKSDNVSKLMAAVLALNSSPIPKPKVIKTDILPACPSSGYFHNCFGTYTFANGETYVGEWKDGKKNGQGTYTYASSAKYVGEWKDGKKNGQGTYTFAGETYVGEYKDDKKNGQGTYTFAGDKYVGQYKDGKQNGQGTYTFASGNKYVGEYKDNKRNGQGTYTFANGNKYVGEFKDGQKNGQGTHSYTNGETYVGEYKDGERNGQGTETFAGGGKYVGQYKDGKQNGQGTETYPDGTKYIGEKKGGKRNGHFEVTFASGDKYVGQYKDGKRNGQGTYTFADGETYVGDYKDGKQNGQGTETFPDGTKFIGEYKDNKRNGHFEVTYASGDKYVGQYKAGKRNGQGTKTFANGAVQEGIWKDGEFQYANKLSPPAPVIKAPTQSDEIISASSGSGFAVSADGYVITNNHVIEGCKEVVVHTKSKDVTMRVITYDPQNDLALLKGDFRPSRVFALSSSRPELLQDVYVAGYPFGKAISTSVKVTKGIISSLTGVGNNSSNIQIDAALQSGNSGGPIIDEMGNVVGVAVSKLDAKYMFENFGSIPENTNFGIKSSTVRNILDSNDVNNPSPNQSTISKSLLGKMISNGTYYISCWMTMAQVEKLRSKKVMFENFE